MDCIKLKVQGDNKDEWLDGNTYQISCYNKYKKYKSLSNHCFMTTEIKKGDGVKIGDTIIQVVIEKFNNQLYIGQPNNKKRMLFVIEEDNIFDLPNHNGSS